MTRVLLAVIAALAAGAVALVPLAFGGATETTPFSLSFEGAHPLDGTLPAGIRHDGRFTASRPFCSAGRAYDVRHVDTGGQLDLERLHTCDDGSGTFTVLMPNVRGEHGGTGSWKIVAGSGRFATLRGLGTYEGALVSGDRDLYETITFTTNWSGAVGFDADPPAIETFTATTRKLRRPAGSYVLRVVLAANEKTAPVTFTVDLYAGRTPLALKRAISASGKATVALRIRAPRGARSVRVALTARDALGNETTVSRSVSLR